MPLIRVEANPFLKRKLILALAHQQGRKADLAGEFGISPSTLTRFIARHKEEIEAVRAGTEQRMTDLWIADKGARMAAYQRDVDVVEAEIESVVADRSSQDGDVFPGEGDARLVDTSDQLGRLMRAKHRALRQAAEELGQIPSKVQINVGGERVKHVLEGVDIEAV